MENEKILPHITQSVFTAKQKTMKAAVFVSPKKIELIDQPVPEPLAGEVRVKMEGCGICGSDLPLWEGRPWFNYPREAGAPGHEGFGIVDALGEGVSHLKAGERVSMLSYHAYAEYDIASAGQVVKLPEEVAHIPFPGEPLGCAMNIFDRSDIRENDKVAVIGAGFIGNLLIQLCKSAGAEVIAVSRRDSSLQKAFESGADHLVKLDDHNRIVRRIYELTQDNGCSRVIEATGKQWPLDLAGDIVGVRGKLIIAGFHQDGLRQVNVQNWNWKGIDVINAHERDPYEYVKGIRNAVEAVEEGKLKPNFLFSHRFGIDDLNNAFEKMSTGEDGFLKGIVNLAKAQVLV